MNEGQIEDAVLEHVDAREVINLAKKLVGFDTTNPPGNELRCARFLAGTMKKIGMSSHIQLVHRLRANAVGRTRWHRKGRTLLLEGHIDTAPIGENERSLWRVNPFAGKVQKGRLIGKGIVDMKGGLAANIIAVKAVLESDVELRGNIVLAATADEEGYMMGVKKLIESGELNNVDACISTEPFWGVQTSIGGRTWGKITVTGRATTSGVNPQVAFRMGVGNNAIHQATRLLLELTKHHPSYPPNQLFRKSWWHVLRIEGGWDPSSAPMCPEKCEITLEGRLVPGHSIQSFWDEVRSIMAKTQRDVDGFHAELEVLERRPAYSTDKNHPLVTSLTKSFKRVTGQAPKMNPFQYPMNSTTDTSYLAANGIACVSIGPVEPNRILAEEMFTANESVATARIVDTTKVVAIAAAKYLTQWHSSKES